MSLTTRITAGGYDPNDSDCDGAEDLPELNYWRNHGGWMSGTTNRLLMSDVDGDSVKDGVEIGPAGTPRGGFHKTLPYNADTDGDGLEDGPEVNQHGTNPLAVDTDFDGLDDQWEVTMGTLATIADADKDPDADDVPNAEEYALGIHPNKADSDADGMPDGYEVRHALAPAFDDAAWDADADGLVNFAEYETGTLPQNPDTDGDGIQDGPEVHTYATDPLVADTDRDGLGDGAELAHWDAISSTAWSTNHDGDVFANNLLDADSDDDRLDDADEFTSTNTRPDKADTDGDGLSDWDEVFRHGGQYDPNQYDTDGDGRSDGTEVALADSDGDFDQDGLKNGDEDQVYGTDPTKPDTDCDGAKDGPEAAYWGPSWNTGGNRLLNADVDGDTIKDGVEIGMVGSPRDAVYRTDPALADSDGDGLRDDAEDRNPVDVSCDDNQQSNSASGGGWGDPTPGPSFPSIINDPLLAGLLDEDTLYEDPVGAFYAVDANGTPFLVGAYGVNLYPILEEGVPWEWPVPQPTTTTSSSSSGPPASTKTNPTKWDTDGDGLSDGAEVLTYGTLATGAGSCDSDRDGLGDGLEAGVGGWTRNRADECTHRDADWGATTSNPLDADTDGDGLRDGREDANANGRLDLVRNGYALCGGPGSESLVADVDTDDDGVRDDQELLQGLLVACFDTDQDGLSDGLETGVETPWPDTPVIGGTNTDAKAYFGSLEWPTWQEWEGVRDSANRPITTDVLKADSDNDGLIDALEDLNHNGKWEDWNAVIGAYELNPSNRDGNGDGKPDGFDSDNDGVGDGRELLIQGRYTFQDIVTSAGWSFDEVKFDSNNPWETDPRDPDTDGDAIDANGDGRIDTRDLGADGGDIQPRANAFLLVEVGDFMFDECADPCWTKAEVFLKELRISPPVSNGDFVLGMASEAHVSIPQDVREWKTFHGELLDKVTDPNALVRTLPTGMGVAWQAYRVSGSQILAFDIPDDATRLDPTKTSASVSILLAEEDTSVDQEFDTNSVDKHPTTGAPMRAFTYTIDLKRDFSQLDGSILSHPQLSQDAKLEGGLKYFDWTTNTMKEMVGDQRGGDNDEDAGLRVRAGDNLPSVFLSQRSPVVKDPLEGQTCYGKAGCVG